MSPKNKPAAVESSEDEDEDDDGDDRPASSSLMKTFTPTPELAAIVGADPLTRVEVVKRIWAYIKKHGLQDRDNPRMINADDKLRPVFGADSCSMFEMTLKVNKHLLC